MLVVNLLVSVVVAALLPAQTPAQMPGQTTAPEMTFVRLGRDAVVPLPLERRLPVIPADSTAAGTVRLEVVVGTAGTVVHSRVAASPDSSGVLDRACLAAAADWRFSPAVDSGRAVAVLVEMRFEFAPRVPGQAPRISARLGSLPLEPLEDTPDVWAAANAMRTPGMTFPRTVRQIQTRYTSEAMRAKIQGKLAVEIVVQADGTVGAARILTSLDKEHGLDREGLITARYWLFQPAMIGGKPVSAKAVLELDFRLH